MLPVPQVPGASWLSLMEVMPFLSDMGCRRSVTSSVNLLRASRRDGRWTCYHHLFILVLSTLLKLLPAACRTITTNSTGECKLNEFEHRMTCNSPWRASSKSHRVTYASPPCREVIPHPDCPRGTLSQLPKPTIHPPTMYEPSNPSSPKAQLELLLHIWKITLTRSPNLNAISIELKPSAQCAPRKSQEKKLDIERRVETRAGPSPPHLPSWSAHESDPRWPHSRFTWLQLNLLSLARNFASRIPPQSQMSIKPSNRKVKSTVKFNSEKCSMQKGKAWNRNVKAIESYKIPFHHSGPQSVTRAQLQDALRN